MKQIGKLLTTLLSVLVATGVFVWPLKAQTNVPIKVRPPTAKTELPAFAADQIIVKFKPDTPSSSVEQLKAEHGATQIRASKFAGFVILSLPEGSNVTKKAEIFDRNPLVEYAHPNFIAQAHLVPNDPIYCLQWHFDDSLEWNSASVACQASAGNPFGGANGGGIGMEPAWDISTGNTSVIVAVLDTGVAYQDFSDPNPANCYDIFGQLKKCQGEAIDTYFQAPDLANTNFLILPGSDRVNGDDHPNDDERHGTHVTGTVAQSTNNNLGVAGMAFNTTVMPVKVLDANGSGPFDVIADAIHFATDNGANVINMSLGSTVDAQVLEDAVAYAFNNGVMIVASAGNDFQDGNPTNYPAAYDAYVTAVGAVRFDETRSYFSSTGPYVDIAAPGGDVTIDQNSDGFADGVLQQTFGDNSDTSDFSYWFFQGTSMAAPHVSALSALLLSADNSLSPTQLKNIMESTTEDKGTAGRDDEYGWGIIDAQAALLDLLPSVSISLTTDGTTPFAIVPLGDVVDTTALGTNDVQTIQVDTGPVNLSVKSSEFSDGVNTWALSATAGNDQAVWEFSGDGTNWNLFSAADTLFTLDSDIAQGETRNVYFKLGMPTDTTSANQYSATVIIVATAP